MLDLDRVSE